MSHTLNVATLVAALTAMLPISAGACEPTPSGGASLHVPAEVEAGTHLTVQPGELAWAAGPGSLPPGVESALIEGDPSGARPFTMRLRFPAGYRIPAHSHPAIEHITVLSGVFHIGVGDEFDKSEGRAMPAGSFVVMPLGHNHFAWTEEEAVVQLHGIGPWGITYMDPANDPRGS